MTRTLLHAEEQRMPFKGFNNIQQAHSKPQVIHIMIKQLFTFFSILGVTLCLNGSAAPLERTAFDKLIEDAGSVIVREQDKEGPQIVVLEEDHGNIDRCESA